MISVILFFFAVSLLFYALFGGADFGAGILELFLGKQKRLEQQKLIAHAMAPVWEANHVWLILAVVIAFMGFPKLYSTLSTYLFLPIIALLLGIFLRGCAFTFRHYDSLGPEYYRTYSRIFRLSSVWSSFFLGVLAGAVVLGRIQPGASDYVSLFIKPWANTFCVAVGFFTLSLFALLASVFLVGEAPDSALRHIFRRKAAGSAFAVMVSGAAVFVAAQWNGFPLLAEFFRHPVSLACYAFAAILWIPFWRSFSRVSGVLIVCCVLVGWFAVQFPVAMRLLSPDGTQIERTFAELAAPEATLQALLVALLGGSALIFPALIYLLRVFKWETLQRKPSD